MVWRLRKRIKITPGVHINLSNGGVSTTIGMPGANVSFGNKGAYLNTSIPGTGLYNRTKIGGDTNGSNLIVDGTHSPLYDQPSSINNPKKRSTTSYIIFLVLSILVLWALMANNAISRGDALTIGVVLALVTVFFVIKQMKKNKEDSEGNRVQIESFLNTANAKNTSSMPSLKKEIFERYVECMKLYAVIENEGQKVNSLEIKLAKKEKEEWRDELEHTKASLEAHIKQFNECQFDAEKDFSNEDKIKYQEFFAAFTKLQKSESVWYVFEMLDNTEHKSSASSLVKKVSASISLGEFGFIKTSNGVPVFDNRNINIYFYPRFIIKSNKNDVLDFEVFPYTDVVLSFQETRFVEDGAVPSDAKLIGYTYRYVNKNGGPDRRYSYNPRYPLLHYGDIMIALDRNYRFQFSNSENAGLFVQKFLALTSKYDKTETVNSNDKSTSIMTEKYFYLTREAAFNLYEFCKSLNDNPEFIKELNNAHGLELMDTMTGFCMNPRLCILAEMDIVTCYKQMEIPVDTEEIERLPITLFFGKLADDNFSPMYDQIISEKGNRLLSSMRSYARALAASWNIEAVSEDGEKPQLNFLYILQNTCSKDIVERYLVLLYRFNSVVAKADNTVNSIERKWLSILSSLINNEETESKASAKTAKDENSNAKVKTATQSNPYEELNSLIGLTQVKDEVTRLTNFIKIQLVRQSKGLKSSPISYHCVFTGNPGTGKTTVARIIAGIYKDLGILKKGQLIETDRSGLVAEYVGQTAVKTNKIIDSALDGVLFVDEAYTLVSGSGNDFGGEAIATLLKRMEDNRDRLVVILAGYGVEMKNFIDSNPGLQSRFSRYINFADYNTEELYQIYCSYLKKNDYNISDEATNVIKETIDKAVINKDKNFGNARFIRNLFEKTLENQATRLASTGELTEENLTLITIDDVINL